MKFGKSYMETLADPSFPKEWREGAIEYKQLKKLINGVVAELESLGLGADVLRDLMVPPEQEKANEVDELPLDGDAEDDHIEQMKDLDLDGSHFEKTLVEARHRAHSPHGGDRSSSTDIGTSSSAEDCELCAHSFLQHKVHQANNPSSPAVQWVSSISHAQHSSNRRKRRSSRKSDASKPKLSSERKSGEHLTVPTFADAEDNDSEEGSDVEIMEPPYDKRVYGSSLDTSSADEGGIKHYKGIGKKDLEELRRTSNVGASQGKKGRNGTQGKDGDAERIHDWGGHAWRERAAVNPNASNGATTDKLKEKGKWVQGKNGRRARAEYELGGTQDHPIPRIRLYVESPVQSDEEITPGDEADNEGDLGDDDDDDEDDDDRIIEIPDSPLSGASTVRPPRGAVPSPKMRAKKDRNGVKEMRRREIVIPLTADTEFLDTLTGALANLSALQAAQRNAFIEHTESLCKSVARVSSPYATQNDLYVWREIFSLWCEFQIFESQREKDRGELSVDESEARLKRFAEEMAKRGWTAEAFEMDAKGKKGGRLAKLRHHKSDKEASTGLPMKDRQSVNALEDFLKLNLALLDVKKFQRVNVEAARKILKKHDKRTALTASSDLAQFMQEQERQRVKSTIAAAAGIGISGLVNIPSNSLGDAASSTAMITTHGATHPSLAALLPTSTTALLSQSLPHILLSLLTTTLLPILPSIDDYSCAICTGVAWRPIQLDCTHLFCIRCLVKLQKRGKIDCPLCRAKGVVGSADGRNMDEATVKFIKAWFPKEVAEKDKENETDRKKEEMQELGLALDADKCCVM